jgi:hypothetical protein
MTRQTMSTTEAAVLLGCTRQNVDDLYRRRQLSGPDRADGERIRLWKDVVLARVDEQAVTTGKPGNRTRAASRRTDPDSREALSSIDRRLERLEVEAEARSTALAGLLGVKEDLEEALRYSDSAMSLLITAVAAAQQSKQAHARASRAQTEMIRQGLLPEPSP